MATSIPFAPMGDEDFPPLFLERPDFWDRFADTGKKVRVNMDSEAPHEFRGKPGRLAPRWLQDLCAGALTDVDGHPGHFFASCQQLPNRLTLPKEQVTNGGLPSGNEHDLLLMEPQSVEAESTALISCMCKHCKYHFVFDVKRGPLSYCGRGPDDDNPLCHLVLANSEVLYPREGDDKWQQTIHRARWECSATACTVKVEVSISPPRMLMSHIEYMLDEERIRKQRQEAVARDPERFANFSEALDKKALLTINAYLRDCLGHSPSSGPKRVAFRNKVFVVQFGAASLPIFEHLGFERSTIDGEEYLILPQPPTFDGTTPVGSARAYYEDARNEILELIKETGQEQVMAQNFPAKARLERALSCYNHPHTASPKQQDDPMSFTVLGAPANSSDRLLQFAFLCQVQTDPVNKQDYHNALQNLATTRGNDIRMFVALQASLQEAGRQGETYQRRNSDPLVLAYEHFDLAADSYESDDLVLQRYQDKREKSPGQNKLHRQMLFRLGQSRNSQVIQDAACDLSDFKEACQFLEVEEVGDQSSAEVLISFSETQIRAGKEPLLVAAAMDTIASKIGSPEMKERAQYYRCLGDQAGQLDESAAANGPTNDTAESANMNLPLGLDNLRNTCYLNSILQYFFTVKAVRNIVLNFDPDKVPPTEVAPGNAEVYLGREFVLELKKLFSQLENPSSARFIKPQQRLANAAWISVDKVQNDNAKAVAVADDKAHTTRRPLPTRPVPPVPSQENAALPTVTVNPVQEESETASISSAQTLTNPGDSTSDFSFENLVLEADADGTETHKLAGEPRKRVDKAKSDALIEALEHTLAQTEIKGTDQMDVEEVMGRCINHLRAAINPASVTNANKAGEQEDEIMKNLYITFATSRKARSAENFNRIISQERWVTANPAESGSLDLYQALDGYFEREAIGETLVGFTSIVNAPPIFHVCIQRSKVGGEKNTNPIVIPEVLYLDRYMESDKNSPLYKATERYWDINTQLKEAEHSPPFFDESGGIDVSDDALGASMNVLGGFGSDSDKHLIDELERRLREVTDRHGKALEDPSADMAAWQEPGDADFEMNYIPFDSDVPGAGGSLADMMASSLRKERDELLATMETYKYCLHSVICHAGQSAKSGHYWVWIYDFEQNIWRKYNDRTVTESPDTQAVLQELSTRGEPYYVMYVRDKDKHDHVNIPRLVHYGAATTSDIEMVDHTEAATTEHFEQA